MKLTDKTLNSKNIQRELIKVHNTNTCTYASFNYDKNYSFLLIHMYYALNYTNIV